MLRLLLLLLLLLDDYFCIAGPRNADISKDTSVNSSSSIWLRYLLFVSILGRRRANESEDCCRRLINMLTHTTTWCTRLWVFVYPSKTGASFRLKRQKYAENQNQRLNRTRHDAEETILSSLDEKNRGQTQALKCEYCHVTPLSYVRFCREQF